MSGRFVMCQHQFNHLLLIDSSLATQHNMDNRKLSLALVIHGALVHWLKVDFGTPWMGTGLKDKQTNRQQQKKKKKKRSP